MYYLRARYYNPLTGRFLSVDSQAGQGQRRYEYANADPIDGMDPSGNEAIIEWALLQFYPKRLPIFFPGFPSWCGFEMGAYLPGCGGGLNGGGGEGGTGAGPGAPGGPPPCIGPNCCPKCFARLKYRPVILEAPLPFDLRQVVASHAFWFVQERNGQEHVIDGGPSGPNGTGNLVDWDTLGTVSRRYPEDNASAWTWWDSGTSASVCDHVDTLIRVADSWPPYHLPPYSGPFGPNSNSFAHAVGVAATFNPSKPPFAVAWGYPIPY